MNLFWPPSLDDLIGLAPTWCWRVSPIDSTAMFAPFDSPAPVRMTPGSVPYGWECPRCHTIYAPSVPSCTCARPEEAPR